jgi:hypothetical protein
VLPPDWTSLFSPWVVAGAIFGAFVISYGPLLWAWLNYRPVTRGQHICAAWLFATGSVWLIVGDATKLAWERGMISLVTGILAVGLLFAIAAGSNMLMLRRYAPDKT